MTPLHPITDALNTPEAASIIVAVVLGAVGTLGAYLRSRAKEIGRATGGLERPQQGDQGRRTGRRAG